MSSGKRDTYIKAVNQSIFTHVTINVMMANRGSRSKALKTNNIVPSNIGSLNFFLKNIIGIAYAGRDGQSDIIQKGSSANRPTIFKDVTMGRVGFSKFSILKPCFFKHSFNSRALW